MVAVSKNEQGCVKIVTLKTGATVRTMGIDKALPVSGLIDVRVDDCEIVSVFRQDLEQRGDQINEKRAGCH